MRHTLLFLVIFFFGSSLDSQVLPSEFATFINSPKKITSSGVTGSEAYRFRIIEDKIIDTVLYQNTLYDSAGRPLIMRLPNFNRYFQYDGGNVTAITDKFSTIPVKHYYFYYDNQGLLREQVFIDKQNKDSIIYRMNYSGDQLMSIDRKATLSSQFRPYREYSYENGKLLSIRHWNRQNKPYMELFEYNNASNKLTKYHQIKKKKIKLSEEEFNSDDRLIRKIVYAGGHDGNIKTNNDPYITRYTYDSLGLIYEMENIYTSRMIIKTRVNDGISNTNTSKSESVYLYRYRYFKKSP